MSPPFPSALLVVEDDTDSRELLTELLALEFPDTEVSSASCAEEALEFAAEHRLDAVVTDLTLPGITGLELARRLKARDPTVGVLLVTGHSAVKNADAVDAVLSKPVDLDSLASALRRLGKREGEEAKGEEAGIPPSP